MSFRYVPKSVTLNDLERRKGRYIAVFQRVDLCMAEFMHESIVCTMSS